MFLTHLELLLVPAHGWQVALGLSPALPLTCHNSGKSGGSLSRSVFQATVKGQKGQDLSELKDDGGMRRSGKNKLCTHLGWRWESSQLELF